MNHIDPTRRSVFIAALVAISPAPMATNAGNAAHAQSTSNVPAFFAPNLCCRTTEVAGVM
jgi:hypothetical protein